MIPPVENERDESSWRTRGRALLGRTGWDALAPGKKPDIAADVWDLWIAARVFQSELPSHLLPGHVAAWSGLSASEISSEIQAKATPFERKIFAVLLTEIQCAQTGRHDLFHLVRPRLEEHLLSIARHPVTRLATAGSDDFLVSLYDGVSFEGEELFASLLLQRAAEAMRTLCLAVDHDAAGKWSDFSAMISCGLRTLYSVDGFFWSCTGRQRMPSVWGSAFAVHEKLATPAQSAAIGAWLRKNLRQITLHGRVRPLISPALWDDCAIPPGTGINGGYRSLPAWWVHSALRMYDFDAARLLLEAVRKDSRTGIFEYAEPGAAAPHARRRDDTRLSSYWPLLVNAPDLNRN